MESMYLNKFHKELYKRAAILESEMPKTSWQERINQFHRIRSQSIRTKQEQQTVDQEDSQSAN